MNIVQCTQGSEAWFTNRAGRVTSSTVADALGKLKNGGESAARKRLRARIAIETIEGEPLLDEGFLSTAMKYGSDNEALARTEYELEYECMVDTVGFVIHPTIQRAGCSPDGIISDQGVLELKVPNSTTHWAYLSADVIPAEYEPQMMWMLACTGLPYCDFMSFDPRRVGRLQKFVKRLHRDEERIREMEQGVIQFLSEVDAEIDVINRRYPGSEPLPKAKLHIDPSLLISDADMPTWWNDMQPKGVTS